MAANRSFLVSDDEDLSTTDLVRAIAAASNVSPILMCVPKVVMRFIGKLTGKSATVERLYGSLVVDIEETRRLLNWSPPIRPCDALIMCFKENKQ